MPSDYWIFAADRGREGSVAEFNEVYRRARYYDIAFRRDVSREVDFLVDLFRAGAGRAPASMLDVACGPGYHARIFAARGIDSHGLDLRPEMVAFARDEAEAEGLKINWFAADMRAFTLPAPIDIMLTSYDSLDCLCTHDEIIDHFRAVARNLSPEGIYVTELTHPRDCKMWDYGQFCYRGERDGIKVEIEWAVEPPVIDPLTQVVESTVAMRVDDHGHREVFLDRARERFAAPQEYVALARLSGALELSRFYGDFDINQPFDDSPGARRMIAVFRRTA